ncbi:MAG: NUDIX domain-containing protein [Candidatus Magasanikbacteria bacterium]
MSIVNVVCSNIIIKDNKILLAKEAKDIAKNRYSFPGGKLEFGESLIEGAMREAQEETGLNVKPTKLIGIYQRPASSEDSNTTVFCFLSEIISGKIEISVQHPEVIFLSAEEIKKLEELHKLRSHYMLLAINDYLNNKGISLDFLTILR